MSAGPSRNSDLVTDLENEKWKDAKNAWKHVKYAWKFAILIVFEYLFLTWRK